MNQELISSDVICKSVSVLSSDFTAPAPGEQARLCVKDLPSAHGMAAFEDGDIVRLRQFDRSNGALASANCWGIVSGYIHDAAEPFQTWAFTRGELVSSDDMAEGTIIRKDTFAIDYGNMLLPAQ